VIFTCTVRQLVGCKVRKQTINQNATQNQKTDYSGILPTKITEENEK
jgi:hypothetical protein